MTDELLTELRELLIEAWRWTYPKVLEGDREGERNRLIHWRRFAALLNAEAYLDAALTLVPEGWMIVHLSELGGAGGCVCQLGNPGTGQDVTADAGERTLALALAAAAIRAKETPDGTD